MLEYKTQEDKNKEITRYKEKIADTKKRMKGFKANSKKGEAYQNHVKDLVRLEAALDLCQRQTPRMTIY
jgi:hypothetical protein